jgi:hypothetical protein
LILNPTVAESLGRCVFLSSAHPSACAAVKRSEGILACFHWNVALLGFTGVREHLIRGPVKFIEAIFPAPSHASLCPPKAQIAQRLQELLKRLWRLQQLLSIDKRRYLHVLQHNCISCKDTAG